MFMNALDGKINGLLSTLPNKGKDLERLAHSLDESNVSAADPQMFRAAVNMWKAFLTTLECAIEDSESEKDGL